MVYKLLQLLWKWYIELTLKAVCIEQVFTLFMALDATLSAAHTLPGDTPEKSFALVAIGGWRGRPENKVMRSCARDRIDQSLESFLVDMKFLQWFYGIRRLQEIKASHNNCISNSNTTLKKKFISILLKMWKQWFIFKMHT